MSILVVDENDALKFMDLSTLIWTAPEENFWMLETIVFCIGSAGAASESVQEEQKKLAINDHDSVSPETDSKDTDAQVSPAEEVNNRDTTTPNDLPRAWKFAHNHPRELIIGDHSEKISEGNIASGNEEPEQATQGDETVTRSSSKRKRTAKGKRTPQSKKKQSADPSVDQQNEENTTESQPTPEPSIRKSPRTRTETQNIGASATQTSKGTRSGKNPVSQPVPEPVPLPKFIDDEARDRFDTDSRRKLSYDRFLTPIFAHFEIPFSGKSPKDSASSVFSKPYFERKNPKFFDGHWCYKETVTESRRKNLHETPVTPRTPHDQSDYVSPFTIHSRKSASKSFSSNSEVISLLEDLKQHVMLLEDGLMMTITSAQQSSFLEKRNLLMPPIPETNETAHQKEPRSEPTGPTTGNETTPASSSQPKDKGKAPVTEEAYEDDDEETEEEEDPEQYRLTRRRPGSSKITI
ncbi:nucleolar and coiled-body phosphoprotein 1-like [Coffea eugenioides]|uniref:nucleolar and coiled-body phosphoprotein 1-like n=1 Tax=Coffea eugenioides TaxID=49369 RepID=UPI000F6102C1|nr:nucleolar and coiled-body phosphoprotein 1-like [Coffea eugenioides]